MYPVHKKSLKHSHTPSSCISCDRPLHQGQSWQDLKQTPTFLEKSFANSKVYHLGYLVKLKNVKSNKDT